MTTTRHLPLIAALLAAACAACGSGGGDGPAEGGGTPPAVTVSIGGDRTVVDGRSEPFAALLSRSDGLERDCTADAAWTSSDDGVATVTAGLATGVGEGEAVVTATCEGVSGSARLTVTPAVVVGVEVVPAEATLPLGASTALRAVGTYSDGRRDDVTAAVAWSSSNPEVATVAVDLVSGGRASAVGTGTAALRAEADGGVSGTADLTVVEAALAAAAIAPVSPVPEGLGVRLVATGTYTDGTTRDVGEGLAWSSSAPGVLTVSDEAGTRGAAVGVAAGTARVTATGPSGVQAVVDVEVTAAQVLVVDVAPIDPVVAAGTVLALAATATYTDDATSDLTSATWTSSAPGIVSVAADGTATARAAGVALVTATDPASGVSGTTTVTVTAADAPVALSYLALSRGAILGGGTVTGTVVLTRPAPAPLVVDLASSGASAAVPATVTVPAGADRVSFLVTTTAPARRKVRVTLSATYDGVTRTATLNVRR